MRPEAEVETPAALGTYDLDTAYDEMFKAEKAVSQRITDGPDRDGGPKELSLQSWDA